MPMRRLFTALAFLALALPAQASLIGTQVRGELINFFGADVFSSIPQPVTVTDPGVEFSAPGVAADVRADRLVLTLTAPPSVGFLALPYRFEFLAPTVVTSASVLPGGTLGFAVAPTLSSNVLTFTNAEIIIGDSGSASVTILLTTGTPGAAVPVPAAMALFGVGLLGLAGAARYRG